MIAYHVCMGEVRNERSRVLADPHADWWFVDDLVVYLRLGVDKETGQQDMDRGRRVVYGYRYVSGKRRKAGTPKPGDLPQEDEMHGRTAAWRPATITGWQRPGPGSGGGRYARRRRGTIATESKETDTAGERVLAGAGAPGQG